MVRRMNGQPTWLLAFAMILGLAIAMPALAQSTGMVKGVVKDDKGQPVDGAKVTIEMSGGTGRRYGRAYPGRCCRWWAGRSWQRWPLPCGSFGLRAGPWR